MIMPWMWMVAAMGLVLHGGAYEEVPVPDGATLTGTVLFAGTVPSREPLPVSRDREVCGDEQESEALVLGTDRGVRGSVVLVEGVTRGKKAAPVLVVSSAHCAFVPHVAAMMVGAPVRIRNADPVLHSARGVMGKGPVVVAGGRPAGSSSGRPAGSRFGRPVFNVALPGKEQVIDVTRHFTEPGAVRLWCGAHPHMSAWLVVHASPYFAVTDERGVFRIDDIPPGTYRVTMWHEGFRRKGKDPDGRPLYEEPIRVSREVTMAPATTVTLDFQLR
jgi:Carboxypeptidase regulatory-like domain